MPSVGPYTGSGQRPSAVLPPFFDPGSVDSFPGGPGAGSVGRTHRAYLGTTIPADLSTDPAWPPPPEPFIPATTSPVRTVNVWGSAWAQWVDADDEPIDPSAGFQPMAFAPIELSPRGTDPVAWPMSATATGSSPVVLPLWTTAEIAAGWVDLRTVLGNGPIGPYRMKIRAVVYASSLAE